MIHFFFSSSRTRGWTNSLGWTQGGSCYFEFSNSHFQGTQWNVTALSCLFSKWTPWASLPPSALPQVASGWVQPHFIVKHQSVCLACTEPVFPALPVLVIFMQMFLLSSSWLSGTWWSHGAALFFLSAETGAGSMWLSRNGLTSSRPLHSWPVIKAQGREAVGRVMRGRGGGSLTHMRLV